MKSRRLIEWRRRIPATLHVAGEPRRSCASCSTRRRRHPPAPLLSNRSGTARVYTDLLRLATRQHQDSRRLVAGFQRPPPPPPGDQAQETTLYLGTRWKRHCRFARQPARPPLVELLYPPLAAIRLARLVVLARQSWRRRVSASFIDSTGLLSSNACSAAASAAAALRDPASSSIELPAPADVVVVRLSVSDAPRI